MLLVICKQKYNLGLGEGEEHIIFTVEILEIISDD